MITSNLKISVRSILKNKTQSIISISGLGIGLGCILLLTFLFIHENSFDRFIPNYQQVYRIVQGDDCRTSYPLANAIKDEIPLVDNYFRYYQTYEFELKAQNNEILKEKLFACTDASIFQFLGIKFKIGRPASSKTEVTISEKMAKKYFKKSNPTGQIIQVRLNEQFINLTVSGVYQDFPSTSTLSPNFIADLDLTGEILNSNRKMFGEYGQETEGYKTNWNDYSFSTYLRLNERADRKLVEQGIQKYAALSEDKDRKEMVFHLQPVADIYLKSNDITHNNFTNQGNASELKYYVAIALLILLIAIINYVFLSKAKVATRTKEIGAKKALGASGFSIQKQLLLESNLMSALSLIPATVIIAIGIPFINNTLNRTLDTSIFSSWQTWLLLIIITLLTGSLSGFFIGVNISRISSVILLRGKTSQICKHNRFGNSFLSLHFAIFILLIVGVLSLKKQINYALTNFQAINPKNIIVCELNSPELRGQIDVIKNETEKLPGVLQTAGSSFIPPFNNFLPINLKYGEDKIQFDGLIMGKGMTELLGIEVIDGEPFGDFATDRREMIFNESAAIKYELKAGELFNGFFVKGIVKDFNGHSLHRLIQPMVILQQHPQKMGLFAIKTDGKNDQAIFETIHKLFKQISPDKIVNTYLLTDQIKQFYTREENQAKLVSAFSLLAIILSVMGLLGMTLNTISKKTKEIGIRKVNGAKVSEVLTMLNLVFLKWVAVAIVIATPLAWYTMNKWLENFAYKTTLSWWIFALAGLLALAIAMITVSWQSWRAATRNPVEALRYE